MSDAHRYQHASPTQPGASAPLTPAQVAAWRQQGAVLVGELFEDSLIDAVNAYATRRFPLPGSAQSERIRNFGSEGRVNFPSANGAFNDLVLHPRLLAAMAQLLDCRVEDLRLTQADLWAKYGHETRHDKQDNDDQRIHVDYPNHTLVHPTPWHRPEAVELIVYFDEHSTCGGATAVVPRESDDDPLYPWPIVDTPGVGELDYVNDRGSAERYMREQRPQAAAWRQALYERERYMAYAPGDVLLYRHDAWHRGTPLTRGQRRLALNITYRHARAEWINTLHVGWAWAAYQPGKQFMRLLAEASLAQRAVLGFPQPGDAYWCPQTIAAVSARYGVFGFDPTPYAAALRS